MESRTSETKSDENGPSRYVSLLVLFPTKPVATISLPTCGAHKSRRCAHCPALTASPSGPYGGAESAAEGGYHHRRSRHCA
eukprot:207274-Prorocentrum_minimum.AAC.1